MSDIVIRNGNVVDGSGQKRFQADIAIENGYITDIAPHTASEAQEVFDAKRFRVSGVREWRCKTPELAELAFGVS